MNDYKITAVNDKSEEITGMVTEANENAAKKDFRVIYRHAGQLTITDVELVRENVAATKQQERDAIEKIRAILETLGPSSYTATALEGCLEIAEQNIEYDFGDSMKSRAESARKDAERYHDALNNLAAKLNNAEMRIAELEQLAGDLNKKILDRDDLIDCIALVQEKRFECFDKMERDAADIVAHADAPESDDFRQAVCSHRSAKRDFDHYNNLIGRLEAAK